MKNDFFARKKEERGVLLNEMQKKAVLQTKGPLLLLASPGSGKTTTIIMRIGYLIEEKGVEPSRIKAVTFSKAAADDMKKRFALFFPKLPPVDFSTIHSLAFHIVRQFFREKQRTFQLIEGAGGPVQKKALLRQLFQTVHNELITDDQLDELTTYISYVKNKMIPPDGWSKVPCSVPEAADIVSRYEEFKQTGFRDQLLDFDDMLVWANKALEESPVLLRVYQQRFDYVLTDESQDTSLVQHRIIEKLVKVHRNLTVVADDDQSIYSWRGAEPGYLLDFQKLYPEASILFMEQNYRSAPEIVNAANLFIQRNKNRYAKNMFTNKEEAGSIKIRNFSDYIYQAKYIVQELKKAESGSETAVLYRNNTSSIALVNELDRAGISFYMKDSDHRFFSHWVVEDVLNFMRMTFTDKRADILEAIYPKINGYITKQQAAALHQFQNSESVFDNLLNHVGVKDYQIQPLKESKRTFQQMKGMPPREAIQVIRGRLGYEKALDKICSRLGFKKELLLGILNTLEEIADTLETMEQFAKRLNHLKSVLKAAQFQKHKPAVTMSTFHSAKGLEFDRVYIVDMIEGIMPSADDNRKPELLEEAVRLFYVGMTRAKTHLELISYRKRDGEQTAESTFAVAVGDIIKPPAAKPEAARPPGKNPRAVCDRAALFEGAAVKHRVFGTGTILALTKDSVQIQFTKQEKTLLLATCFEMELLELV